MRHLLELFAKPFIGSGLTSRFPWAHQLFFTLYAQLVGSQSRIFSIPLGAKLRANLKDANTGIYLSVTGSYEPLTTNVLLSLLNHGDTVIDIGANIGYFSILAAKKVGDQGKVIAFEPDQSVLPLLQENLVLNQLTQVTVETVALSDKKGEGHLQTEVVHQGHGQLSNSGQLVQLIVLKDYLQEHELQPKLIKMDIEGAELAALKGIGRIHDCHLIIEVNQESTAAFGYGVNELLVQIEQSGFIPHQIIDESRGQTLPYSAQNLTQVFSHVHYTNLHCIPANRN